MKMQSLNTGATHKVKLSPLKNGSDDPMILLNGSKPYVSPVSLNSNIPKASNRESLPLTVLSNFYKLD